MADLNITSGGTYKIENNFTGTITIATSSAVTLDGTNASNLSNVKIVASSNVANLTIKNLTVTNSTNSVIKFGSGTGNKLTLIGINTLKSSDTWAAIVHVGGGLTINGTGSLNVIPGSQSSGIGSNSYESSNANIVINGGRIIATGDLGAGIGSGSNGSIGNITVNTVSVNATSNWGKGIGAGYYGSAGKISITIVGDTSDDVLVGTSGTDTFAYTSGNDVITNYGHEDTVHIRTGKIDGYSFDGSDLIFKIGNGSLRLNNMTNHAITVKDSSGNTTTKIYGTGYSGHEVIKRFVHSMSNSKLDTKLRLDEAIRACSHFNSLQEVINQLINDLNTAGDAETFLKKYCGIFPDNKDNGSVIGWDAGGLQTKTTTKRGLTLTVPAKNTLTEDEQLVVQKIYSADMEDALKLIEETYGFKFTDKPLTIPLYLVHQPSDAPAWAGLGGITANLSNGGDNPEYYLSHELTHVAQQHFGFFDYMPNFMFEGMADLTAGGDVRGALELASDPSKLAQYLTSGDDPYTTGVIFWRYLMRQAADSYDSSKSYTWKENSSIKGTATAEFLTGSGKNMTLSAGAGNDTLTIYGENMKVLGEGSNDYILISSLASGASIDGGLGNDTIRNEGVNVTILGGAGNDSIENYGANVTIDGGSDDNQIKSHSDNIKVTGGDGNDTLLVEKTSNYNWDKSVWEDTYHDKATIDASAGSDFIKNENSNASINASKGNDSVENHGNSTTILGGAGNDSIENYGANVTIDGGSDDDQIKNHSDNVKVMGGDGKDSVENSSNNVTINSGDGNDTVTNDGGQKVKIDGGAGNDSIQNNVHNGYNWDVGKWESVSSPDNATINGGTGKDTIENYGANVSISAGAGDDSITNHAEGLSSTLLGGKGNDKINNWAGEAWNEQTKKYDITPSPDNTKMFGEDGNDTIYNEGSSVLMDGGIANDILINGGYFEGERGGSKVSLLGGSGNDTLISHGLKSLLNGGVGADLIYNGYRYYEPSSSFFAPDDKNYDGSNTTIIGGIDNDTIKNLGDNILFKYTAGDGNDSIVGFNATSTLSIAGSIYSTQASYDDVIITVGKGKITLAGAATLSALNIACDKILTLTDKSKFAITAASNVEIVNASARKKAIKITGNTLNNSLIGGKGNDKISGSAGSDKIWGNAGDDSLVGGDGNDALSGGTGNDRLYGNASNDNLYGGDGNDTLSGGAGNDKLNGGNGKDLFIYSAGKDVIADFTAGQDKIKIASGKISKSSLSSSDVLFTIGKGSLTVKNAKGKSISLIDSTGKVSSTVVGAQTLSNSNKANVIIGADMGVVDASKRTKAISITGNTLANTISGGSKNDTIYGGNSNDSILGNAGNDTLYGGKGDDKLFGNDGNDRISGDDGKDTIDGGAGADILWGGKGEDSIIGGAGNDSLVGYDDNDILKGGSGNDTLSGGKGNDSLWGNAGKDTFIYANGDGNDIIYGFDNTDMLKITGKFSTSYNKSNGEISFKIGSTANAITLKDFSATSFNVNGATYKISGSKLVKK